MRAAVLPEQLDVPTQRVREAVDGMRRQSNAAPWANGKAITGIVIGAAGSTETHHNLGHLPGGFFVIDVDGLDGSVARSAWTTKTITLTNPSAAEITVAIWIW